MGLLESLNVLVHHTRGNSLNFQITNNRIDIIGNQCRLAVVHGYAPLLFSVCRNKVIQKIADFLVVRRKKCAVVLLILNLCLSFQRFFVAVPGFPFLFRFSIFVNVVVNNRIRFFTFDN